MSTAGGQNSILGDKVELQHLGKPFSRGTQATPDGEQDLACKKLGEDELEQYDVEMAKKRILIMALQRVELALMSKQIDLKWKAEIGLKAHAQFEGVRKEIVWDKREVDEKGLVEKADKLQKHIANLVKNKKVTPEQAMQLEAKAADIIVSTSGLTDTTTKN